MKADGTVQNNTTDELRDLVLDWKAGQKVPILLQHFSYTAPEQNQLLLIVKPEITRLHNPSDRWAVIAVIAESLRMHQIRITGTIALPGWHLASSDCMIRHYGLFATADHLDLDTRNRLITSFLGGGARGNHLFLTGKEVCARYQVNIEWLTNLWRRKPPMKIKPGLYAQTHEIDGDTVVLLNGFFPGLIASFHDQASWILAMALASELPWGLLRERVLGAADPHEAAPGSMRRQISDKLVSLGYSPPTVNTNGVHLSAGPFEALFELHNLLSPTGSEANFCLQETAVARRMTSMKYAEPDIDHVLANPAVSWNGSEARLFALTENTDTGSAVHFYRVANKRALYQN